MTHPAITQILAEQRVRDLHAEAARQRLVSQALEVRTPRPRRQRRHRSWSLLPLVRRAPLRTVDR